MDSPMSTVLFCPFCRESHEGRTHCPDHDLELVAFSDLPERPSDRIFDPDQRLAPWEWRYGRGAMWLGALVLGISFFTDSFELQTNEGSFRESAVELLLRGQVLGLWLVPLVAACAAYLPLWASTPRRLSLLRRPMLALSLTPPAAMIWALFAMRSATEGTLNVLMGGWLVFLGCGLCLLGSLRLGAPPGNP